MTMTKADIINEINRLTAELPSRKKIASIAEHEGLEIAFEELTDVCVQLVKTENYKDSKKAIKNLEVVKNFRDYLKDQKDRIENIENRIAQLRIELTRCQLSLFDEDTQKIATGIQHEDRELYTGDTFELPDKSYLLITESQEHPNNYCIVGTAFSEELLLQYPKNRKVLDGTAYLGNIFENDKLAEFLAKLQEEQEELQKKQNTAESQENVTSEETSSEDEEDEKE